MDFRTDTSSGRFGGQWAFLSNPPQHGPPRSVPSSSYLPRSDHSILSPAGLPPPPPPLHQLNASRSSLLRNHPPTSIGRPPSTTAPSQPVLIRVHSQEASAHQDPMPRGPRRRRDLIKNGELPPVSDFSIQGILAAIQEDIEGDIDAISEILGRSRLTLADQHESHMPPQGEIRANARPLQGIEEASSSNEQLAGDEVLILREDASLVDGSLAGSRAYSLLGRLQAVPRVRRQRSDGFATNPISPHIPTIRTHSSPAVLPDPNFNFDSGLAARHRRSSRASRFLLQNDSINPTNTTPPVRTTNAVVSETYLLAGGNGRPASNPPIVSESGRNIPLYSYDESDLFEATPEPTSPSTLREFQSRFQSLRLVGDILALTSWLSRQEDLGNGNSGSRTAEAHLREILERQLRSVAYEPDFEPVDDDHMYD